MNSDNFYSKFASYLNLHNKFCTLQLGLFVNINMYICISFLFKYNKEIRIITIDDRSDLTYIYFQSLITNLCRFS